MGKAIALLLTIFCNQVEAADKLAERVSKVASSPPIDLDGTTIMKAAAPAAYKPSGKVSTKPVSSKTKFFFIDDPEIVTEKTKRFGGTTKDLAGKGKEVNMDVAVPTYWGGGGNAGGRQAARERTWVGKGTKGDRKGLFNFIDDPEIATEKTKRFGGTTKDLAGVGMPVNEAPARPKYWGGSGDSPPWMRR